MVTSENSQPPIPTRSSYYSSIVDQPFSPYFLHNGQNEIIQRLTEIKMPNIFPLYFLHNGEISGTILVLQLLSTINQPTWSRLMTKNKLGFVDESNAKSSDPDSPLFQVWWNEIYSD